MLSVGDISAKRCWTGKTLVGPRSPYTRNWLSSWKEILASYRKEILLSSWKEILYSSGVEILSVTLTVLIMAALKKILPLTVGMKYCETSLRKAVELQRSLSSNSVYSQLVFATNMLEGLLPGTCIHLTNEKLQRSWNRLQTHHTRLIPAPL